MGIDAVHLNGAMTGVNEYHVVKHQEDGKAALQQANYQNQFEQKVESKLNQVQQKDDSGKTDNKFDAREKSNNEYAGDGGKKKKQNPDGIVKKKITLGVGGGFDIKI